MQPQPPVEEDFSAESLLEDSEELLEESNFFSFMSLEDADIFDSLSLISLQAIIFLLND